MNIKKIIVLDLDETLLFSSLQYQECSMKIGDYYVRFRPFLGDFLESLSGYYTIAIWSSASETYVHIIVKKIRELYGVDFLFVWGESYCSCSQKECIDLGYFLKNKKDLIKVVKKYQIPIGYILIVDDDPIKVNRNYGNAIYIDKYLGENDDNCLFLLKKYLFLIKDNNDFRSLEKRNWKSVVNNSF